MLCFVCVPPPGIVANNASGMCCGVANNTYNTLDNMRIVLVDGTVLDTADKDSCDSFMKVCGERSTGHLIERPL
jgi:D-lactate dehydrogenase